MKKRVLRKIFILFIAFALVFSQAGNVFASDGERESLEDYLEELKEKIESVNQNLDDIYNSIDEVNTIIVDNSVMLEELNVSLAEQKTAMMKRIQYMYEAGANMDILLALLTSDSISESLNRAAYISQMVTYDRDMLETYVNTIHTIDETMTELEAKRAELLELKDSFEDAKYDSALALEEATIRLAEYDIEESRVQEVIEEYMGVEEVIEIPDVDELISAEEYEEVDSYDDHRDDEYTDEESSYSSNDDEDEDEPETTNAVDNEDPEDNEDSDSGDGDEGDDGGDDDGGGYYVPISTYQYSEQEIYDLARVTYLEDGCVYPEGSYRSIYLCACVILNRANNWYGGSISSAIYASGQYATAYKYTNWGGGPLVINDITWTAVNDALSNCDPNPYYQCNGQHLAGSGLTEYYRDPGSDEVFYYPY